MGQTKYKIVIDAVNKSKRVFSSVTAALGKIGSKAKAVGGGLGKLALGITATVGATGLVVSKYVSMLDKIGKTSEKLGIDPVFLQKLRFAAEQTGVKVEALDMGLQRFIRRTAEAAKGTGEAKQALADLGIALFDDNNQLRDIEEVFFDVADAIANTTDSAEQVRLAFKFFDSEGVALVATLKNGSEGLREFFTEAENLGILISNKTTAKAEKAADAFNRIKKQINALVSGIIGAFLPALEGISKEISVFLAQGRDVEGTFDTLGETIANKMVEGLARLIESFAVFLNFLERSEIKLEFFAKKMEIAFSSLRPIKDLRALKEELKKQLDAVGKYGDSAKDAANKLRKLWQSTTEAEEGIKRLTDTSGELGEGFKGLESFMAGFDRVFNEGRDKFADLEKLGEGVAKKLEDGLVDAFMNIKSGAEGLRDVMDQILKQIVAQLIRVFVVQKAVAAVTGFFGGGKVEAAASGGTVRAGKPYLVGEKGAELFVPGNTGTIVPNDKLGGANTTNVSVTFDIKSWDSRDSLQAITEQAPTIVGIIDQSFRKRGRRLPA